METPGFGFLGRLSEKVLGYIALALVALGALAIYQIPGETKAAIWSGVWRSVVWGLFSAAWPWTSWFYIRRVAEAGTNWAGLTLIGGLTAGNLVAAALLMTGWPLGVWGWLASLTALGLAATYNYLVAEYLAETGG